MYHAKDGLFFERLPHGDLRIVKTDDGKQPEPRNTNVVFETILQCSVVASLMACACTRGYTTDTFFEAYEFLKAKVTPYELPQPPKETTDGHQ